MWSDPYTFFTTQEPGITASVAYQTPDGEVEVLAFDILLQDILEFAKRIQVRNSGIVFVLLRQRSADDLMVLALPPERIGDEGAAQQRGFPIPIADLSGAPRTFVDAVFGSGTPAAGEPFRFNAQGEHWWGAAAITPLSEERELWIAATIPEDEILQGGPGLHSDHAHCLLVTVALMLFRARLLARRYGDPIGELVAQTQRIGRLNFSREMAIESPIQEVQTLATSQDSMRLALASLTAMNHRREIARELRRLPAAMLDGSAGPWRIALFDQPAADVGGTFPMSFPARREDDGSWALADGPGPAAVALLVGTQLRDMAAAQHGPALRAATRALLRRRAAPRVLLGGVREELTRGAATVASVAVIAGFLDGERGTVELLRDGETAVLHWRQESASTHWPGAGTDQIASRVKSDEIRLASGDRLLLAPFALFDLLDRDRQRLRKDDLAEWLAELSGESPRAIADEIGKRISTFAGDFVADADVSFFVIG